MSDAQLATEAQGFAAELTSVIQSAIGPRTSFEAQMVEGGAEAIVGPAPFVGSRPTFIELNRSCDDEPVLFLRANFNVGLDGESQFLQVLSSTLGLFVDVRQGNKPPKPLVRVEYERKLAEPEEAAAHVHLHANSPELAWVYGSCGNAAKDLHSLHFPVGGSRFRPTLEEFLLFLDREDIFNDWTEGWHDVVLESLGQWRSRQAAATVRRFPEEAMKALERLGFQVIPPRG